MTTVIEVDSRKRVSLGSVQVAERYIIEQDEEGVITLTPAVVLSELEARLLRRPDILEAVAESRRQIAAGFEGEAPPVRRA